MQIFIFFYDQTCPACPAAARLVADIELEFQIPFKKIDVGESEADFRLFETFATACNCEGVPFLYCIEARSGLCNFESFRAIKKWVLSCQA